MISFVSVGVVESLHNLRLSATPPVVVADADKEVCGFIALLLLLLLFCSMGELTLRFEQHGLRQHQPSAGPT